MRLTPLNAVRTTVCWTFHHMKYTSFTLFSSEKWSRTEELFISIPQWPCYFGHWWGWSVGRSPKETKAYWNICRHIDTETFHPEGPPHLWCSTVPSTRCLKIQTPPSQDIFCIWSQKLSTWKCRKNQSEVWIMSILLRPVHTSRECKNIRIKYEPGFFMLHECEQLSTASKSVLGLGPIY